MVIPGLHIEFGEDPGSFYVVHDLVDPGKGVSALDGDVVELPVVDHQAFCTIFLSDKKDQGCGGALV